MKLKSLISALVVFTLVMTCAMSAVSADECVFKTTTTYSTTDVTVTTTAAVTTDSMVSYIIYDETASAPTEGNIKYIDQQTATKGSVSFTVTDTIAKLNGRKVIMGSDMDTINANVPAQDGFVTADKSTNLIVSVDEVVDKTANSVTFLVHQNGSSKTTGINVYAYDNTSGESVLAHTFLKLENLSGSNYYAIELVDETNTFDFTKYAFVAIPYVVDTGLEMQGVNDTTYFVEDAE